MNFKRLYLILSIILVALMFSRIHAQDQQNGIINIGGLTWMSKNLDVEKFRNGDVIRQVKSSQEWIAAHRKKEPVWMYYNNSALHGLKYGKIYNYYAVIDGRNLAPKGYHIPAKNELDKLSQYSNNSLKSATGWYVYTYRCKVLQNVNKIDRNGFPYVDLDFVETECSKGGSGDNSSGFNAFPAGKINSVGVSESMTNEICFWSMTPSGNLGASSNYVLNLLWNSERPELTSSNNYEGFYVRCVYGKSIDEMEVEKLQERRRADSVLLSRRKYDDSIRVTKIRIEDSISRLKKRNEFVNDSIIKSTLIVGDTYNGGIVVSISGNGTGLLMKLEEYYFNISDLISWYARQKNHWRLPKVSEMRYIVDLFKTNDNFRKTFKSSSFDGSTNGWGKAQWWYALPENEQIPTQDNLWYVFRSDLGRDQRIKRGNDNPNMLANIHCRVRLVCEF